MSQSKPVCALISVSDKTGVVELAQALVKQNITILSTGGTAHHLKSNDITVTDVSDYTGFPEIMNGRVKTLHPKIHGGILSRRGVDDAVLLKHDIQAIDIVVVNLYPFNAVISDPKNINSDNFESLAIENIDIGGPCMIRAAAKNHASVAVVTDVSEYSVIIAELDDSGSITHNTRKRLAQKAFTHTAHYDAIIANFFAQSLNDEQAEEDEFPTVLQPTYHCQEVLRYGENPHQAGAFYTATNEFPGNISTAVQLQGKALSYNNIADADTALECVKQFNEQTSCVIVKHANPCGVASSTSQLEAYVSAHQCDPTSAFGGIIAFNTPLNGETAQKILENQFVEVIIAPKINEDAIKVLAEKPNIRALATGKWQSKQEPTLEIRSVTGGLLAQQRDLGKVDIKHLRIVTKLVPTDEEMLDLVFAWQAAKFVKSNAIVYAKNQQTLGIGAGQMSRIDSAKIAVSKAQDQSLDLVGSVMASDAFFPFSDCIEYAASHGIKAIIQPGGSIRDEEVIACADKENLIMVFTGMRHFKH